MHYAGKKKLAVFIVYWLGDVRLHFHRVLQRIACNLVAKMTQRNELRRCVIRQGHLVKGEDTEAFSSLLWSRNCQSKTVGANPNLRPHLT
jgi:hypothetical protein